jgi:hypothetical protein
MPTIEPTLEGQTCPCCSQLVKLYRRKLSVRMVEGLVRLYLVHNQVAAGTLRDPNNVIRDPNGTIWIRHDLFAELGERNYSLLRFWGLMVPRDTRTATDNASGFWSITYEGVQFVRGTLAVPEYVYVFNNTMHSVSAENVLIQHVHSSFDYAELMKGKP